VPRAAAELVLDTDGQQVHDAGMMEGLNGLTVAEWAPHLTQHRSGAR
jgi:hypothetical protein